MRLRRIPPGLQCFACSAKPASVHHTLPLRGYQGLGANVTRYDGGFARDWHEGLDFYKEAEVWGAVTFA